SLSAGMRQPRTMLNGKIDYARGVIRRHEKSSAAMNRTAAVCRESASIASGTWWKRTRSPSSSNMTRARLLTVVQDITVGIAVGVTLGSLIFMHRMARMVAVETHETVLEEDQADSSE